MTHDEIRKIARSFQGANREFSQEMPRLVDGLLEAIDEAGPEVVNNLESNSPTKALSANMGKELKVMVDGKLGVPSVEGEAGQILQLDAEANPEWVTPASVGVTYDSEVNDESTNAIQNKAIKKYVDDTKAAKDGYYASLTAGAATNLVGRGSVPAQYLFRTTGGTADVGTGSAVLSSIKGRSIVWNQLVQEGVGSVTTISGHKYLTRIAGVDAIVTSTGDAILVDDASKDNVHDLTLLGLGDITIAQFKALFPRSYYAYNPGQVLPFAGEKLVTTGFNQWDEEWENGYYNSQGVPVTDISTIRSKNLIQIFPGTSYYLIQKGWSDAGSFIIRYYDANKSIISSAEAFRTGGTVVTPSNAYYMNFHIYATTYNHDICINLSWSGIRNGEYESYEKHTAQLGLNSFKVTDGTNIITVNGLKSAGSAYDEIVGNKYIKRVGVVDLGSLTWDKDTTAVPDTIIFASHSITERKAGSSYLVCNRYVATGARFSLAFNDMAIATWNQTADTSVVIRDDSKNSLSNAEFKTAMSGVMLYYELATPVEYDLVDDMPQNFYANDWGTEEWQPANGSEPYTAPCNVDVQYAMNAVDLLRNLPRNYIGAEDFDTYNAALAQALASVGITMTYARTFNQQTDHHEFTITMAQSEGQGE